MAPFVKELEHVAKLTDLWDDSSHILPQQYAYFLYVHLLDHNLCKPKSTTFVYFSRTEDCSFFKVNT